MDFGDTQEAKNLTNLNLFRFKRGFCFKNGLGKNFHLSLLPTWIIRSKKMYVGKKEELVQATDPSSSKFKYETKLVNLRRYVIFCNFPWAHHTIWVQLKTWIVWLCNNGWFPAILNWVSKLLKFYAQQKLGRKFIYFTHKYPWLFIQVLSWSSKSRQGLNQVYDD